MLPRPPPLWNPGPSWWLTATHTRRWACSEQKHRQLFLPTEAKRQRVLHTSSDSQPLTARSSVSSSQRRSVQRNAPIIGWRDQDSCWSRFWGSLACTLPVSYRLTSSYLEVKQNRCGRVSRELIDLADIEDVSEEGQCCCCDCIPCPCLGCGVHELHIHTRDDGDGRRAPVLVSRVETARVRDIFHTLRNVWERHHHQIRLTPS